MKDVTIHAALLALALVAAFATWTGEDRPDIGADTTVEVWDRDPEELISLVYEGGERKIELERREGDRTDYVWGVETMPDPEAAFAADTAAASDTADTATPGDTTANGADTPAADTASSAAASPPADTAPRPLRTEQFPVGDAGTTMMDDLAQLRALRDLGEVDDEKRDAYGLTEPEATLTLRFRNGDERVLSIGKPVVGGGHRYVLDNRTNRVYVLAAGLLRPLEYGGTLLRLSRIQSFEPNDVHGVTVRTEAVERTMQRRSAGSPPSTVWTPPGSDRPDQTFANFMDQLGRLWVTRYVADASTDTLQRIVRADYLGEPGDTIGTLELFRTRPGTTPVRYYVRTDRTIVPGEVDTPFAERVEQDVQSLFGRSGQQQASVSG